MADMPDSPGATPEEQAPAPQQSAPSPEVRETVGDLIRKERITRRIAVETVAKDLRLNVKYIKSLEANQYDALPPDPYIRVYLRSISRYLMLDADAVLKKFFDSRGMSPADYSKDTMTKLDVSRIEPERSMGLWIVIFLIIGALAGVSYVASRFGGLPRPPKAAGAVSDTAANASPPAADSVAQPSPATADSTEVPAIAPPPPDSGIDTMAAADSAASTGSGLVLGIRVMRDSAWVQVFSDGTSWKKTLYPGYKNFRARDSLNVHVGYNGAVRYTLNGSPLTRFTDPGVVVFKIARGGKVQQWTLAQWQSVFKGRL